MSSSKLWMNKLFFQKKKSYSSKQEKFSVFYKIEQTNLKMDGKLLVPLHSNWSKKKAIEIGYTV